MGWPAAPVGAGARRRAAAGRMHWPSPVGAARSAATQPPAFAGRTGTGRGTGTWYTHATPWAHMQHTSRPLWLCIPCSRAAPVPRRHRRPGRTLRVCTRCPQPPCAWTHIAQMPYHSMLKPLYADGLAAGSVVGGGRAAARCAAPLLLRGGTARHAHWGAAAAQPRACAHWPAAAGTLFRAAAPCGHGGLAVVERPALARHGVCAAPGWAVRTSTQLRTFTSPAVPPSRPRPAGGVRRSAVHAGCGPHVRCSCGQCDSNPAGGVHARGAWPAWPANG
jgi:hypothetical protein